MSRVTQLATLLALPTLALSSFAAEAHVDAPHAAGEAHGVSPVAAPLFHVGPLPVTNSMVTSWVIALALPMVVFQAFALDASYAA